MKRPAKANQEKTYSSLDRRGSGQSPTNDICSDLRREGDFRCTESEESCGCCCNRFDCNLGCTQADTPNSRIDSSLFEIPLPLGWGGLIDEVKAASIGCWGRYKARAAVSLKASVARLIFYCACVRVTASYISRCYRAL